MADPTRAAHLVAEDTLASRSLTYSLEDLSQKVHDFHQQDAGPSTWSTGNEYDSIRNLNHDQHTSRKRNEFDPEQEEDDELAHEMAWQNSNHSSLHKATTIPRHRTSVPTAPASTSSTRRSSNAAPLSAVEANRRRIEWWRRAGVNVLFILGWYMFSSAISVYNKWMFSEDHYNFPYPLFVTSFHMLVQWVLSAITLQIFTSLRSENRPAPKDYGTKVLPCGVASGLDIGLSNLSLRSITLSFYTMCKSSGLAFVLIFAFMFRLEKPSWRLVGIILIISGGVVLMVSTETQFDLAGMIEVLTASAMGGLRWSLVQILLDKESLGMSNPIATLYWLAPIMGITLATCSMIFDGWGNVFGNDQFFGSIGKMVQTFFAILFPGLLAFAMNITEFGLIQRTSVVTLSVAGIFKEVAVIFLSMFIFHDQLTPINVSGLCVTLFGIGLYNYFKYKQFTDNPSSVKGHGHGGHRHTRSDSLGAHQPLSQRDGARGDGVGADEDDMLLSERERTAAHALGVTNASAVYLDSLPHELTRQSHHTLRSNPSSRSSSRSSISIASESKGTDSLHLHRTTHAAKVHRNEQNAIPDLQERLGQGNEELFALEKEQRDVERMLDLHQSPEQPPRRKEATGDGDVEDEGDGWDLLMDPVQTETKR